MLGDTCFLPVFGKILWCMWGRLEWECCGTWWIRGLLNFEIKEKKKDLEIGKLSILRTWHGRNLFRSRTSCVARCCNVGLS